MDTFSRAATNRSFRTIQTELEFLQEASALTTAQVSSIQAILDRSASSPAPNSRSAAVSPAPSTAAVSQLSVAASQLSLASPPPAKQEPTKAAEAAISVPPPVPSSPAPPAYDDSPLAHAIALYHYAPTDEGDVELHPQDRVAVLMYHNADWARGRNERTGQVGVFPRSYVSEVESSDKKENASASRADGGYGNMPMAVANGGEQPADGQAPGNSKFQQQGKKFGKKLGNATIFGAGATIGSNIVNSIL